MKVTIKHTVAMPVFKGQKIAWLALEGLCKQKQVPGPWELVIFEDGEELVCGKEYFEEYRERLEQAGMARMDYRYTKKRHALSLKWREIAERASDTSELFFLQAADCFADPLWLYHSRKMYMKGADFVSFDNEHFYNIPDGRMIEYFNRTHRTHMGQIHKTKNINQLPKEEVWRGVDGWILSNIKNCKLHTSDTELDGLGTDGHNTVSIHRSKYYDAIFLMHAKAFRPARKRLREIVPPHVADRLEAMKEKKEVEA